MIFNRSKWAMLVLGLLLTQANAWAVVGLKQVQISNTSQINLVFDAKVSKSQIKTEFFNDIIQISLNDAQVYPAKISPVNGDIITKVFAYQYAPKLVRCRLSVKGKAEAIKDQVDVSSNGKVITINVSEAPKSATKQSDRVSVTAAAPVRAQAAPVHTAATVSEDDKKLLEKVMKVAEPEAPKAVAETKSLTGFTGKREESSKLTKSSPSPLPSPWRVFSKFFLIIGLFCLVIFGVKKFTKADGALGKLGLKARKGKMIEVVSNHYLGPKKSISVVKVAGRMLVLGVTNDSINLITQIGGDQVGESSLNMELSELEEIGIRINDAQTKKTAAAAAIRSASAIPMAPIASLANPAATGFSRILENETAKPAAAGSVRAQIRTKLEGFKPL